MQKKTILYLITQSDFGGAQRYIFDLAANLKNDFKLGIIAGDPGAESELAQKLKEHNISFYYLKSLKRAISPLNDLKTIFKIIKIIKIVKPDIIHLNSSKISILSSIAGFLAQKLLIIKYKLIIIYTVHGWVFNEPGNKIKQYFYFLAEKLTAKAKNKIICINKQDYALALEKLKIPENKLNLILNGLNSQEINFLPQTEALKRLNINKNNNQLIIGNIANLYKTKGHEYLIKAIDLLNTSFNLQSENSLEAKLIIIGEGPERKNLEKLIIKLNLENKVILTGNIQNANNLLKAFDVYAFSSIKEGLPYAILEACAAELPIASTNVGGISEILEDEKSGLLVLPQSPERLAQALKKIILDKDLSRKLGQNAKLKIQKEFKLEKMLEETKKIYLN